MRNTSPPQHPEQALVRYSNATCYDDCDPESLTPCRDTLKRRRNSRPHAMFGTTLFTNGQNQRFYPRFNLLIQPIINIACLAVQGVGDQEARATENARHHLDSLPRGSEVRPLQEPKRVNKLPSKKAGSAQKNAGDPFGVPFTCSIDLSQSEIKGREQRNKLMNLFRQILMPDGPQACNIFLCSGKDTSCDIISASVPPEADETEIWRAMNEAWYHHRGLWRKYIPMFGVNEIEKVKISILGQLGDSYGRVDRIKFRGRYRCLDSEVKEAEERLSSIDISESFCNVNFRGVSHGNSCQQMFDAYSELEFESFLSDEDFRMCSCPADEFYEATKKLSRLKLRSFFLDAFLDANVAKLNHLLAEENLIISERDFLEESSKFDCPQLCELEFNGLLIRESWKFDSRHIIVPLAVTFLFILIIGSRFLYGDWSTAWTFGGFLVSFVSLLWMWANHAVSSAFFVQC